MNRLTATHRRRLAHAVLTPWLHWPPAGAPGHAAANGADLTLNVDFTTWTLMGSAASGNTVLPGVGTDSLRNPRLTVPGQRRPTSSAYAPAPLLLDFNAAFEIRFRFFVAHGSVVQGDGLTFFMTGSDPALGTGGGSGLGYSGSGMNGAMPSPSTPSISRTGEAVSVPDPGRRRRRCRSRSPRPGSRISSRRSTSSGRPRSTTRPRGSTTRPATSRSRSIGYRR
ncbi:MAG: hypothetical protein R3E70_15505 [Burkholderiaceae bacterium]